MEQHFTYVKHRNHLKAINWSITLVKSQLISEQTRNQMKFPLQSKSKQPKKKGRKEKKMRRRNFVSVVISIYPRRQLFTRTYIIADKWNRWNGDGLPFIPSHLAPQCFFRFNIRHTHIHRRWTTAKKCSIWYFWWCIAYDSNVKLTIIGRSYCNGFLCMFYMARRECAATKT